ncbi:MAG TPA: YfiR family protein [Burkholderiaceae bacterium]
MTMQAARLPLPDLSAISFADALRRLAARPACALMLLCACALISLPYVYAQTRAAAAIDAAALERNVKAAFLYKFMSYIEWPAGGEAGPIHIGVLGNSDVVAAVAAVTNGRMVNNRPLVIKAIAEGDPLAGLHAVYFSGVDGAQLSAMLRRAQQRAVLTVTDTDDGLARGSVINFKMLEGRVRFDVSLDAAERNNLRLSSRMLSVAHVVQKGAP